LLRDPRPRLQQMPSWLTPFVLHTLRPDWAVSVAWDQQPGLRTLPATDRLLENAAPNRTGGGCHHSQAI
jgi:hypothetical protein